MKRFVRNFFLILFALDAAFPLRCRAEHFSAETLFKEALLKETGEHDPDAAIVLYRQAILQSKNDPVTAAKAELRLGFCEEQLGNTADALKDYLDILKRQKSLPADISETAAANVERLEPPSKKDPQVLLQEFLGPNEWSRRQALGALQSLDDAIKQGITPQLAADLTNDDPAIRFLLCQTLAGFGPLAEEAVPALEPLIHDPFPRVRVEAVTAMQAAGRRKPDIVLPFLTAALIDPNVLVRRQAAAAALGPMALQADDVLRNTVVSALSKALMDPDSEVRLHALYALASMGQAAASSSQAIEKLANDPDPQIRFYSKIVFKTVSLRREQ